MDDRDGRLPSWLLWLFGVVLLFAAVLTVVGAVLADGKGSAVALEAAKAGIQLGAITVVGAGLTYGLRVAGEKREQRAKQADVEREERRRLNDYRMSVFRDTVDAYNRVKAVRRALRAIGMDKLGEGRLRDEQVDVFDTEMRALNDAELVLERIEREVTAQSQRFAHASSEIRRLEDAKDFLRNVLTVWESRAFLMTDRNERQLTSIEDFRKFVAKRVDTEESTFWPSFSRFEQAIRDDLVEPAHTN